MVTTGARARALEVLLRQAGYKTALGRPPAPRAEDLSPENLQRVDVIYQALGGTTSAAHFRPGPLDLALGGGLVVELDEELHFNRYRRSTLEASWTRELPWRDDYLTTFTWSTSRRAWQQLGGESGGPTPPASDSSGLPIGPGCSHLSGHLGGSSAPSTTR